MDWSESYLAAIKGTHKIKDKILSLCLRCWNWNSGKLMLLTVSDQWAYSRRLKYGEDYPGRSDTIPAVGEMAIECNRLHRALSSNWWKQAPPNTRGSPYLCMPLWVDQTPSWNNPFHRHKRWKLPPGCNCEADICCSSGCEVRLWRTQVCTLSKEMRD